MVWTLLKNNVKIYNNMSPKIVIDSYIPKHSVSEPSIVIPFENRISHILPKLDHEPSSEWIQSAEIAKAIGARSITIREMADKLGIEHTRRKAPGVSYDITYYPPLSTEVIRDEINWQVRYENADDYLNYAQIADVIEKHEKWVSINIKQTGIEPRDKRPGDHNAKFFPKKAALRLREMILSTPLDNDWVNITDLEGILKSDPVTIRGVLEVLGINGEDRRAAQSGRIFTYYPPDTVEEVKRYHEQMTAGDWLTANAIVDKIAPTRSEEWVSARLSLEEYKLEGRQMLDVNGAKRIHFPPSVFNRLLKEMSELDSYKKAGDYVTVNKIAKELGHYASWVTLRLPHVKSKGEPRISIRNRVLEHFPPEIIDELRALPEDILEPGGKDWFTFSALRRIVHNKHKGWIRRRLDDYQESTKTMEDIQGVERTYYSREVMCSLMIEAGLAPPDLEVKAPDVDVQEVISPQQTLETDDAEAA